jgi:hypothetical protein
MGMLPQAPLRFTCLIWLMSRLVKIPMKLLQVIRLKGRLSNYPSNSTPPPSSNPLHIEKPTFDVALRPPKSVIQLDTFNPNSHATQNYNIVEYLVQVPCAMSALEVLHHFLS